MIYDVYVLALMWLLGCIGVPLVSGIRMVRDGYDREIGIAILLLGLPVGVVLGVLPWLLIGEEQSPDLAVLKKNEWVCSSAHTETYTTMILVGKVLVPQVHTQRVCDQYNRS